MNKVFVSECVCIRNIKILEFISIGDGIYWGLECHMIMALITINIHFSGLSMVPIVAHINCLRISILFVDENLVSIIENSLFDYQVALSVEDFHGSDDILFGISLEIAYLNTSCDVIDI